MTRLLVSPLPHEYREGRQAEMTTTSFHCHTTLWGECTDKNWGPGRESPEPEAIDWAEIWICAGYQCYSTLHSS